jgi:nitroimidazol reductase NimA-like FMN-containing flavoprotein (pyridoxamine 5'-phosphate oxidase superfamily)
MVRAERPDMPDYDVPTELDGVLPWEWAQQRLIRCRNYWVVTASAAGRPHALPVWGVWLVAADRFAFACGPSSRKARNLAANPQVVVAIDDTVECVSVEGIAVVLDPDACQEVIAHYVVKYEPDPVAATEMATFLLGNRFFEIVPQRAFGIIERPDEFSVRATRWVWD